MPIPPEILTLLHPYTSQSQSTLLDQLLSLPVPEDPQLLATFNEQFQLEIIKTFMQLMTRSQHQDLCSLLDVLWKALRNRGIRKNVLVTVLDSLLECVGVGEMGGVLGVIRERVGDMREVVTDISHHLLRVINTLLKRISKTTDFQVRGQLHLTITRIINLCHESGFEYRPSPPFTDNKIEIEQGLLDSFKESNLSMEFYEDFWELQRYFMDLGELGKQDKRDAGTPGKEDAKLISFRLKRIQIIIDSVLNYFKLNKPQQHKDFSTFPLKFLKLPNLLALQLQDSYFRLVILTQGILFCESLKQFPAKHPIQMMVESKECVKRIEKKLTEYLEELVKWRDEPGLVAMVGAFVRNDAFWIGLKDSWRERKKTFFRVSAEDAGTQLKKASSITSENAAVFQPAPTPAPADATPQKKPLTLAEIALRCKKQIEKKMQIRPTFIEHFISHTEAPVLKKQPISPSFAYYYSQARRCLQTFDEKEQCQTQFQSRSEYNLFEWKAFRSLQRERIVTLLESEKGKFGDYRLLDFIKKKEDVLEGEPRKRVKPAEDDKIDY